MKAANRTWWGARAWALILPVLLALPLPSGGAAAEPALWQALREGTAFAMMRHAIAPGVGDPAGFALGDCATQRNLSDRGRTQARDAGRAFRRNGVAAAAVFSSQWCRCLETARLLGLGPVMELDLLNSFFGETGTGAPQTRALTAWLADRRGEAPLVLVTHQVNITALVGRGASSGEIVFVTRGRDGRFTVLGAFIP